MGLGKAHRQEDNTGLQGPCPGPGILQVPRFSLYTTLTITPPCGGVGVRMQTRLLKVKEVVWDPWMVELARLLPKTHLKVTAGEV